MKGLIIHAGAEYVDYDQLRVVPTPPPTSTHVPLPHHQLVDMVRYALGYHQHEIVEEHHAIMPDGQRYFGLFTLQSPYADYQDTLGIRNSHDKSWPVGLAFGARVIVCDNTSFNGEIVVKRKHTINTRRDLPGIVAGIVEPLQEKRIAQQCAFEAYRNRHLLPAEFDHLVMQLYRSGGLNVTRIADVVEAYERPPYDWGSETAWRAFNAVTYALKGKVAEAPQLTQKLHQVIDGFCEHIDPNQLALPELA